MGLTSFSRGHTANNIGAVFHHLACMKGAFTSCEALNDDFGIAVDENAHVVCFEWVDQSNGLWL